MTRRIFCKVLLVAVAIFGLLVLSGVLSAQGRSEDAFERVREVQERNTDWLMAIDGVEGTAIGLGQGARPVVLVLLEHGGVPGIPEELEGVTVRPLVTGKFYALSHARFPRPVPIGVSTGHPDITAGTIACRVTDGTNVYALSNNHVYADHNLENIGDGVIQPGTFDGGSSPADDIGNLYDFEPINFDGSDNTIDAAIAISSTSLLGTATPSDGYGIPSSSTVEARLRLRVQKYGRTTGLTSGRIAGINAIVNVNYGAPGVARFVSQIIIRGGDFSAGGDSGSLIVTDDDNVNPVGLLFAGSSSMTVANPIGLVLARFGVSVDDSAGVPGEPQPPVADAGSDQSALVGETVTFDGSSSYDPDGPITFYEWNFDDGTIGSGITTTHSYLTVGIYTVILTVTNNDELTDTDEVIITVTEAGAETSMHVGDLDAVKEVKGKSGNWEVFVTVTIHDETHAPVANATVTGELSGDITGTVSGITGSYGTVTFTTGTMKGGTSVTFTVNNVKHATLSYDSLANHETSITVTK